MTKKMLIDATHAEETRVAITDNGRLEEFDYESSFRKPLRGNIYLAKVTRVEPSLQAAFVNYGGNRHGFLPFSEIHPDYFRIPIADREALIAEQEKELAEHDEAEEDEDTDTEDTAEESNDASEDDVEDADADGDEDSIGNRKADDAEEDDDAIGNKADDGDEDDADGNSKRGRGGRGGRGRGGRGRGGRNQRGGRGRNSAHGSKKVETFGGDELEGDSRFRYNLRRKYKIQEVVKRGQIMLIQVSKEERGNKGAAVTSYLSLPGRYCVLMPNSPRGGGVSRKISNYKDRAKMRDMMKALEVPKGMSVILRTAGLTRTKTEIKRDLDYLMKLWNRIRELTLESTAPALVYEEADLVKRAVRDLYTREIEDIQVAGEEAYKTAKEFMKMMIPSHAKRVVEYKDPNIPLFNAHKIEAQIADIGETSVTLKSGGYLIINPTEALVSIDVNSGRATKERHIEETALKTNLEAADEVARQLRLRDLGGLVVIDFIDMENRRNNGKVERRMRDALSGDKARIQLGKISNFGLMEMSRQRLSQSLGESQYETCSHCAGSGRVRTADAASILVLRDIEAEGIKGRAAEVMVHVPAHVALYILNNKRSNLAVLEERYGFAIVIRVDDSLGASDCRVEVSKPLRKDGDDADDAEEGNDSDDNDDRDNKRGGRRRGRRGGRGRGRGNRDDKQSDDEKSKDDDQDEKDDKPKRGRRSSKKKDEESKDDESSKKDDSSDKPKGGRKSAAKKSAKKDDSVEEKAEEKAEEKTKKKSEPKKKAAPKKKVKASNDDAESSKEEKAEKKDADPKDYEVVNEPPKQKKKGWWSK